MKNALVTGGGGFVGRAVIHLLQEKGVECSVIGRNRYPDLEKRNIQCFCGDISDVNFVCDALKNIAVVFHVAALAGIWGKWEDYYNTNVIGTRNVIRGCLENNIAALVYTSTPSVVFNRDDIINGDETLPYAVKPLCNYAKSKILAEREILAVSHKDLKSCALRPHLIWGPGDPHLVPRLIDRGMKGLLKIVGDGSNLVDLTYIDNVAHAHILAAENLQTHCTAAGNAYFIGQERPVNMWKWVNDLFKRLDVPPVTKKVSLRTALAAGGLLEAFHNVFLPEKEPRMTRFVAEQLAKSHYFSHKKAENDLGYHPIVSLDEGMERLIYRLTSK